MSQSTTRPRSSRQLDEVTRPVRIGIEQDCSASDDMTPASYDGVLPVDRSLLNLHHPDAHWEYRTEARRTGRCSLWWTRTPMFRGHTVGFIGHLAADGAIFSRLLQHACAELTDHRCTLAVGPVDGSTWRNYRCITDRGTQPPFFLEPQHPPQWPTQFERAGFFPLARYFSALCVDPTYDDPRIRRAQDRLIANGVRVRNLRAENLEADLLGLFDVARTAFRSNLLYSEPSAEEFLAECRTLAAVAPLDFVLLAERAGEPVGFVFAVPDLLQRRRGEPVDTLIIKTLAALPERGLAGLGQWLLADVQRRAHAQGLHRAIHALVRDAGHLQRISGRTAVPIRKYTLFAKVLQP
jgi:GNAT superfamily N-acetyltransferase